MDEDQIFQATRKVYALYGAFFKSVAEEVGLAEALVLHAAAHEEQGMVAGKMLKDKMSSETIDLQKLGFVLRESNLSIGIACELAQASASSVLFRNSRCPLYDGYRMGGLDDAVAEDLCQTGASAKLGALLKQLDPTIIYRLSHYRSRPEESCTEEILHV